ncbi:hypothetical protein [Rhizobium mesosinicum]|uniref:Uncharacterized protein n=1 Tax=Rhizobium mesosinicum TaxID=335017 RepID=A0ABS7GXM4_9HYPH|nr:hypothetical protein [Rhizobium mesosinicum]MBW9054630.1 hypothetical protein [Rhizobium mesosinicum]
MSEAASERRHPFLDDLADDVVLISNVLQGEVRGSDSVLATIKTGSQIYASPPTYHNRLNDGRTLIEYDAELVGGRKVHAVVVVDWNGDNKASRVNIGFAPLGGALAFATRLGELLAATGHEQTL